MSERRETATLAGGCFWCTEAVFARLRGVMEVMPGYAGGTALNPTYEDVCSGSTGHAEAVQIVFDPEEISFEELLDVFWQTHDPTSRNRQGADEGTQYRSAIFFHDPEQQEVAERSLRRVAERKLWPGHIVTEVVPLTTFYPAESYHRDYYRLNRDQPYCRIVIDPKVTKLFRQFPDKLKDPEQ
ncbi:peptide-methionine (S)-S-oxide reductase MsrA [Geobacter sp. DSM 9736]|uniref:peptide-methionine (S)-S-oxide reductase MsrA n=1 Tax=Geobacter sp. DSM 9736 TaxID=1277350 RepID=UPI000B4FD536|nr:peptide-methionine (S)-S-oxide reductase MsrA [Geobacter sp. DSM 9736]SNB44974.1 peptide-methionine (S)-S-oxide reductase [Geobacter sp. DSM 9736]